MPGLCFVRRSTGRLRPAHGCHQLRPTSSPGAATGHDPRSLAPPAARRRVRARRRRRAAPRASSDKLVIVTSFSKDLTAPYAQRVREEISRHQGRGAEPQHRRRVAFIRETRSSPPDIFWASAPDAFEVLKKDSLLQKYKPKAQGVADKVGCYPINDPRRLLCRLRRLRLRHHVQHALSARQQPAGAEGMGRPQEADLFRPRRHLGAVALRHHAPHRRDHPAGRRLGQRLGDCCSRSAATSRRSPTARSACPTR